MDSLIPPVTELLHPIQALANIVYLAKHEPGNKEKVLWYMTMAEAELARLTEVTRKLALLNTSH